MQKLVWKNSLGDEIDLTSGNYGITQWEGFSNTSLNIQSQQVPFQDGGVYLDSLLNQRELSVTLKMQDNGNLEERYRMRRELIHILNPKLGEGYLIYTNDFISKRIKCVAQVPLFETHNSDTRGTPKASLSWTACEPYWEDFEEIEVILENGDLVDIENSGDVDVGFRLIIEGNGDSFRLLNATTNQEIKKENDFHGFVDINTGLGVKSALEYDDVSKYQSGGYWESGLNRYGRIIVVGSIILVLNVDGTKNVINVPRNMSKIVQNRNAVVAIGGPYIYYSQDDGKNWQYTQTENTSIYSSEITVQEDKFILRQRLSYSSAWKYYESTDGADWQLMTTTPTFTPIDMTKIYDGEKWVRLYTSAEGFKVQTSTNNSTWVDVKSFTDKGYPTQLFFAYGEYIIIGQCSLVMSSKNLTDWTVVCGFGLVAYGILETFVYENTIYMVGNNKTAVYTDDNFQTLHQMNIPTISSSGIKFSDVLRHNNTIIITLNASYYLLSNNGGLSFTQVNMPYSGGDYSKIKYINGYYYMLVGNTLRKSSDAENWTDYTLNTGIQEQPTIYATDFTFKPDGSIYFTVRDRNSVWKCSAIGQNCNLVYPASLSEVQDQTRTSIAYGNETILAVGKDVVVINKYDNVSVYSDFPEGFNYFFKVDFVDSNFILLGEDGICLRSKDGSSFIQEELDITNKIMLNAVIKKGVDIYYVGTYKENDSYVLFKVEMGEHKNIIGDLTKSTDMGSVIKTGTNRFALFINGSGSGVIRFRKKYIGV